MDLLESLTNIYRFSKIFGIAPYVIKKVENKNALFESNSHVMYSIILSFYYLLLQYFSIRSVLQQSFDMKAPTSQIACLLDGFSYSVHFCGTPFIYLKFRKIIVKNLNQLNNVKIYTENKYLVKEMEKFNNLLLIYFGLLTLVVQMGIPVEGTIDTGVVVLDYIMYFVGCVPLMLIIAFSYVQFCAYVNIVRLIYKKTNEFLILHRLKVEVSVLKDLKVCDNILKDFLQDMNQVFSFNITFLVIISFTTVVDGMHLLVSNEWYSVPWRFVLWLIYLGSFLMTCVVLCTSTTEEVINFVILSLPNHNVLEMV